MRLGAVTTYILMMQLEQSEYPKSDDSGVWTYTYMIIQENRLSETNPEGGTTTYTYDKSRKSGIFYR